MKKAFTFLSLFIAALSTFSQENDFNISVTVKGMENQNGILAYYYGDKKYIKDTLKFDNKGMATIKGKKNIASGVYLIAFPSMKFNSFDVIIKETAFSISTDTANFIKNAVVKNSTENKQMFEDMHYMMPLGLKNDSLQKLLKTLDKNTDEYKAITKQIESISKEIISHRKSMVKKYPNTFYSKLMKVMLDIEVPESPKKENGAKVDSFFSFHYLQNHYFDYIDFADSGFIRSPIFHGKLLKYLETYTFPQTDSIIKSIELILGKAKVNSEMFQYCLNEIFMKYAKSEIMGHDAIYVYLADNYYLNGKTWWATEKSLTELRDRVEAIRPTLLGKIAPNFSVQDTSGKSHNFHDFVSKNKYSVLVFWNSDCGHCQKEIPLLNKIYADSLKALGVRVFAVSTEQTDSTFRAFVAKNCNPDWVSCADMRGVSAFRREYDIIATPKVFIVNQDYKIIAKSIPVDNMVDFILFIEKNTTK